MVDSGTRRRLDVLIVLQCVVIALLLSGGGELVAAIGIGALYLALGGIIMYLERSL